MKLKETAGWNQTEEDWRRLLQLEPEGCFAALLDGELVGTTTSTTYGTELGWIGMVLVNPANRRAGIATALLNTVLEYLRERVTTIKLDATADGRHVYARLGFAFESLVERWFRTSESTPFATHKEASLPADSRRELLAIDRRAFVADRSRLIEALISQSNVEPVLMRSGDQILTGYGLARTGTVANYVGPIIASGQADAAKILDQVLSQIQQQPVFVDLNTEFSNGTQLLVDRGFEKQRDLIRMSVGRPGKKTSSLVFAIAGPEVG